MLKQKKKKMNCFTGSYRETGIFGQVMNIRYPLFLTAYTIYRKNVQFKMYRYSSSENTYQNTKHILNYNCTTQRCKIKMKLQICISFNFLSAIHKNYGSCMKHYRYILLYAKIYLQMSLYQQVLLYFDRFDLDSQILNPSFIKYP